MISCPNCGGSNLGLVGTRQCPTEEYKKSGIKALDYLGCLDCNLIFQKNKIDPSFYKREYRKVLKDNNYDPTNTDLKREWYRANTVDIFLKKWGVVPKSVLDVGSATGEFLRYIHKQYGCSIIGVEPCDSFRAYSNDHKTPSVENIREIENKYDLVATIHVLEHMTEPIPFLEQIIQKMSGYVYIEVPYLAPSLPHHILFTKETLENMVERVGIKIIHSSHNNQLRILGML
jgi:ubiquinone/menaquinone biosynthesis C-methylase UbiE